MCKAHPAPLITYLGSTAEPAWQTRHILQEIQILV